MLSPTSTPLPSILLVIQRSMQSEYFGVTLDETMKAGVKAKEIIVEDQNRHISPLIKPLRVW